MSQMVHFQVGITLPKLAHTNYGNVKQAQKIILPMRGQTVN